MCGLGGKANGVPREDGFDITVASEIMAVLCLATGLADLKARLGRMVVAYTRDDRPVTAHDLKAEGAMTALLKDAIKPNLVQTLEHTPALIHGGPFANIAHGCNSITATDDRPQAGRLHGHRGRLRRRPGRREVSGHQVPLRRPHPLRRGGRGHRPGPEAPRRRAQGRPEHENLAALEKGLPNLLQHVENITQVYGLPCVVAINRFPTDTEAELKLVEEKCKELGVNVALSEVWAKGGEGGEALAEEVVRLCEQPTPLPLLL